MAAPNWPAIRAGIFAGESGGDYNALFGFSNRPGKQFANARLTDMTVDDAINFSSPSGQYGQWVKGQIGRVATPMGAYQIVGTTLRGAKQDLGLTGNERMTPELQDRLGQHILAKQGTGAWEGYRGPGDPSKYPGFASVDAAPGKVGGDSMVARNFDAQTAPATNTPTGPLSQSIFGSMAPGGGFSPPDTSIDPNVAAYAFGEEKDTWGSRLQNAGKAFSQAANEYQAPRISGGGGDARQTGNALADVMNNPNVADLLLKKRAPFLFG